MWLFICLAELLALSTIIILWWFIRPHSTSSKILLFLTVVIFSNAVLIYGLSDFWRERFRLYLIFSILQGFMIYVALMVAATGLLYCKLLKRPARPKLTRVFALLLYMGLISLAVFNSYSPVVNRITIHTNQPLIKPITMALVSDTHLGRWFGNRQIDKLVALIDSESPDVVVLAGDIMDDNTEYYEKTGMRDHLTKLHAPLGVYAVLGNHDYLGHEEAIEQAVKDTGIRVLDNEAVLLDDSVWLIGRSDDLDQTRLSAKALLAKIPPPIDKPVVFLEHRPSQFAEISALPIDMHLSGHTHGGQIFPLTTIMRWTLPLSHGAKRINETQFLVSSGYGFGSVPFRLGTRSEIWIITLQ